MKRITKLSIISIVTLLFLASCNASWNGIRGNGNKTFTTRSVSDFDGIEVAGSYNVQLIKGTAGKITIEAEENLIDYIVTEVENNTLHIYTKDGFSINSTKGIHITVGFNTIDHAHLTGSGSIKSNDTIDTSSFTTSITGSGDIELQIEATKTDAEVTGSGSLSLAGTTNNFRADVTGSGDISSYKLTAKNVNASVGGSGGIELYCKDNLKAEITGSGDIYYKGNPTTRDLNTTGSGDIHSSN